MATGSKAMRIVLCSLNFSPEPTGIGKYSGDLALELAESGHTVRVVCAPPHYPDWAISSGYSACRYSKASVADRLTVFRCPIWIPSKRTGLRRLLHLASFSLTSFPVLIGLAFWRPKVVICIAPALLSAPGALFAARLGGSRAWLHVQDFELEVAFRMGLLRGSALRHLVSMAERFLLKRFDWVSTISHQMARRLVEKGVSPRIVKLMPNAVDTDLIFPMQAPSLFRKNLALTHGQIVCLFAGTINRKQGLSVVIDAARQLLSCSEIHFVIAGSGDFKSELAELARGLKNVSLIDLQPAALVNELLNLADIHVLPQLRDAADLVFPSKLAGMLASGRPVVAGADPGTALAELVEGRGIVVRPEDATALAGAILMLSRSQEMRAALGHCGRRYAEENLSRRVVAKQVERDLKLLLQS